MLFNDVDLAQWLIVSDVQRNVGTSHTNTTVKIGNSDGSLWQNMSRNSSTIVVTGILHGDLAALRRTFAGAIDYDEPKVLVFGDEPDVYYNAIYDGQPTMTELSHTGTVSLSFLVPDGVAHSVTPSVAEIDSNGQIMIDNKGTYPSWPIISATMNSDNGVIALTNDQGGVLEFGDPDEVDTEQKTKSDKPVHDYMRADQDGYTPNVGPYRYTTYVYNNKPNKLAGSIKFNGLAIPTFVEPEYESWSGPSLHRSIGSNSSGKSDGNFTWKTRFDFNDSPEELGRIELSLTSGDDIIASFTMRDSSKTSVQRIVEFYTPATGLKTVKLDVKKFADTWNKGFYELSLTRNEQGAEFKISVIKKLTGETVTPGASYSYRFYDEAFQKASIDGITCVMMKFYDYPPAEMDWTNNLFTWINVPYTVDLPNQFEDGDTVTIDVKNSKIYVNDVLNNSLQRVGNDWDRFRIMPGSNNIKVVTSSWADPISCKVTYEEAWK